MYDLGEQFKIDLSKAVANSACVFKGNKYRITVLTERLVRLEYNEESSFIDNPTQLVLNRNLEKPNFSVTETSTSLKIVTRYFELSYKKEKSFDGGKLSPAANLKIKLLNTDKVWYYNHPEARNFGAVSNTINDNKFVKGLYSLDGFASIDDSNSNIIYENGAIKQREKKGIDIYVFMYNKDFYLCLSDYFAITGNPPMIPRYALGNWWCKSDIYNNTDIANIVNKFEKKGIPVSIFMLDNWDTKEKYIFDDIYGEPKNIVHFLNTKNIKLGLSISDLKEFKPDTKIFENIKKYLAVDKNGNIPFNLFDEKTIDAYLKLIINPIKTMGAELYFFNDFVKKEDERNFLLTHYLFNNIVNNRALISSYNSLVAAHRYPVSYTGKTIVDWETLRRIPEYNLLASNMGVSLLSHDFGGTTHGVEDSELFIRYIQLAVFSPILRLGSDGGKYYKREPWRWDLFTYTIVKEFLNLRYKLIPYIYTECYKYHKYGKPLIEPLYRMYPELYDDDLYSNEYFFGSNILVSPILNKKDPIMNRVIHKLYIPDGIWYDMFTGKKYTGNKRYVSFYKEEEYPVFVKAGAIIPKAVTVFNDTGIPSKLEIDVFPGANNTYSIYEDDGVSNKYKTGEYLITNVEYIYKKNNYVLTILPVGGKLGIIPEKRDYKIRFKNTKIAANISSYVGNNKLENKYYREDNDLVMEIKDVPTNGQLTIICKGNDIEIDALRIINEDIVSIISDLPIKTVVKEKIDSIMFSKEYNIKKKRIEIRKLANGKDWIEKKYVDLFLKLLEYIKEV